MLFVDNLVEVRRDNCLYLNISFTVKLRSLTTDHVVNFNPYINTIKNYLNKNIIKNACLKKRKLN